MVTQKISVIDALVSIRNSLDSLSVTGSYNAKLLSAVYDDLGAVIDAIAANAATGGDTSGNSSEDSSGNV